MNTINELIERAHSQAKAMGWWDEERNTGELLMLVVSECGEALEAHRKGRMGKWQDCTLSMVDADGALCLDEDLWVDDFKEFIKDGFADELADIVIRIADLLGKYPADPEDIKTFDERTNTDDLLDIVNGVPENMGHALLTLVNVIMDDNGIDVDGDGNDAALRDHSVTMLGACVYAFAIARKHNIDLWRHIDLKLRYNLTRGVRHGKAY